MKRYLMILVLVGLMLAGWPAHAQDDLEAEAIRLASEHPAFAVALTTVPNWTAVAYDTGNRYGIWHVEFQQAEQTFGWADVSPQAGVVYAWEVEVEPDEDTYNAAERSIRAFLRADPTMSALTGQLEDYEVYIWYEAWNNQWAAWVEAGPDSLQVYMRSADVEAMMSHDNLELLAVRFPNVLSYAEWQAGGEAQAIAIAFREGSVGAAVRDANWVAHGERNEDGIWTVYFYDEAETLLVQVTVDLLGGTVEAVEVP